MRIRLMRFGYDIELSSDAVTTLQVEDRQLFTRIVRSLMSEQGEYAEEPYLLICDDEKAISPKKALWVINELPSVPLSDKQLIGPLFKRIIEQSELDSARYLRIHELMGVLIEEIESIGQELQGSYSFNPDWELEAYLKAFGFSPDFGDDYPLVENCFRFFELCSDTALAKPLVFINAKSFFSQKELESVIEKAVFQKNVVLFIESWLDETSYKHENKVVIDQQFCVL